MSPTKKPSAVSGLRRGMAVPQVRSDESVGRPEDIGSLAPSAAAETKPKPARVTLNLPPSLMRDVEQWTVEAAATMDVPRVSVQDAMRGMIRASILDKSIGLVVIDLLRRENGR